jgi:WD40 repeat protein
LYSTVVQEWEQSRLESSKVCSTLIIPWWKCAKMGFNASKIHGYSDSCSSSTGDSIHFTAMSTPTVVAEGANESSEQMTPSLPCSSGVFVVTVSNGSEVNLWDGLSHELLWTYHCLGVGKVAFSPDSSKMVIYSRTNHELILRDLTKGTSQLLVAHTKSPQEQLEHVCMNKLGTRLITCYQQGAIMWDLDEGIELFNLHGVGVTCCFVGDRFISYSGKSFQDGRIHVWDSETGRDAFSFRAVVATTHSLIAGMNGSLCAACGHVPDQVSVWDVCSGQRLLQKIEQNVVRLLFIKDDSCIIIFSRHTENFCKCYDIESGSLLFRTSRMDVGYYCFLPAKSTFYVVGLRDNPVTEYDAETGTETFRSSIFEGNILAVCGSSAASILL